MKLLFLKLSLDKRGWTKSKIEIEVKETTKSYTTYNKRISKDNLMKPNTIFMDNHSYFRYTTYCFPEYEDASFKILKDFILQKVDKVEEEFDLILSYYNTELENIPLRIQEENMH